jgi:hypothetical protein
MIMIHPIIFQGQLFSNTHTSLLNNQTRSLKTNHYRRLNNGKKKELVSEENVLLIHY